MWQSERWVNRIDSKMKAKRSEPQTGKKKAEEEEEVEQRGACSRRAGCGSLFSPQLVQRVTGYEMLCMHWIDAANACASGIG